MTTLATSRATGRDRLLVIGLCASMVALNLICLPFADIPLQRMPGMVAFQAGLVVALDGITAFLLFNQLALLRLASLLIL